VGIEILTRTLDVTDIRQLENWISYIVLGVPSALYNLTGEIAMLIPKLVREEVAA
jgi:hypothetical protein